MIADDHLLLIDGIKSTLKDIEGFTIADEAYNGFEVMEKLDAGLEVDVILMDINMPKLDGIGLIRQLREKSEYKFTPIVMLTTESQENKKNEGKQAGASGWIVKPFIQQLRYHQVE